MRHEIVMHPTGLSAWCCSFPETGSEPQLSPQDQFIYELGQERDRLVTELAAMVAVCTEVNQDAERYRWLKSKMTQFKKSKGKEGWRKQEDGVYPLLELHVDADEYLATNFVDHNIDATIDAAIRARGDMK